MITIEEVLALQERVGQVRVEDDILNYVLAIAESTRRNEDLVIGLSPRGTLALVQAARAAALMDGRDYVIPEDVRRLATSVCAHRLITKALTHDGSSSAGEAIFRRILDTVHVPA